MNTGSVIIRPSNRLKFAESVMPAMISSGAVSPMTRAMASVTPVTMPPSAVGQHDLRDRPPLRHAQRVRRLAQLVRHQLQHLLGRAHDDRDHQQRQRDRAAEAHAHARPEDQHEQRVGEEAGDDRRDAGHHVDEEVIHRGQPVCRRTRRGRSRRRCRSAPRSAAAPVISRVPRSRGRCRRPRRRRCASSR